MKKNILFILAILISSTIGHAQLTSSINYQAVARNSSGIPLRNQDIGLRISIIQDSINGKFVFLERHKIRTNNLGLFNIAIGEGDNLLGDLGTLEWGSHAHFLQIEMDENGGTRYVILGTSQLLNVPYALYAERSKPQSLSINGNELSISEHNTVTIPLADELWERDGPTIKSDTNIVVTDAAFNANDTMLSSINIISKTNDKLITMNTGGKDKWYLRGHIPMADQPLAIEDPCLLLTTDEALKRKSFAGENYQKYGLKIYPDGGMATPNLTFGDYRFGDSEESHPVRMYYGDNLPGMRFRTGTSSDHWPDFIIDASDNQIIFRTQWGTTFYGGIVLKSGGPQGNCFRITIDDNGDFVKKKITCP